MTAVHLAASCGQLNCLSFLTNFGSNIWALNNDGRTPLEEAALHNHMDCVRHLDGLVAVQKIQNRKKVERLQQQAQKDAAKRIHKEGKLRAQRDRAYEKRVRREQKEQGGDYAGFGSNYVAPPSMGRSNVWTNNQRNGTLTNQEQRTFSQLTGVIHEDNQQNGLETRSMKSHSDTISSKSKLLGTLRSKFNTLRGKNSELSAEPRLVKKVHTNSELHSYHSRSVPLGLNSLDSEVRTRHCTHLQEHINDSSSETSYGQIVKSVDSRGNTTTHIQYVPKKSPRMKNGSVASRLSQGTRMSYSASDLASIDGLMDLEDSVSEAVFESHEVKCLVSFLSSLNLDQFSVALVKESIDLSSLSLLSDEDLQSLGIPLGPRRKILEAIRKRNAVLENPGLLGDSKI